MSRFHADFDQCRRRQRRIEVNCRKIADESRPYRKLNEIKHTLKYQHLVHKVTIKTNDATSSTK